MSTFQFILPTMSARRIRQEHQFIQGPIVRCAAERQALFDRIAPVYDNLNDLLSLGNHRVWKRMSVSWSGAREGDTVLDVCCGSGDLAFLLSEKVGIKGKLGLSCFHGEVVISFGRGDVFALDFSREQLQIAATRQQQRAKACYKNIEWIEGNALDLPFSEPCFDAATIGYGLRNVVDKKKALEEMYRVLRTGSKVSILDFNKSTNPLISTAQDWFIDYIVVPVASSYGLASEYQYLKRSIKDYQTGDELEKLALEAGFAETKFYEIGAGLMGNLVATK